MKTNEILAGSVWFIIIVMLAGLWLSFTANLDKQRMAVEYCWDSNGQHYVAPDPNCTH